MYLNDHDVIDSRVIYGSDIIKIVKSLIAWIRNLLRDLQRDVSFATF